MQRRVLIFLIFQIIDLIITCSLDIIQFNVKYIEDIHGPKREFLSIHTEVLPEDSGTIITKMKAIVDFCLYLA